MGQENDIKKRSGGKHFTWEERVRLEALARALYPGGRKPNFTELARQLGRRRSSVSREYRRGKTVNRDSQLKEFPVYSAQKAQDAAWRAALNKGPRPRLTTGVAAAITDLLLREKLSPYAAVITLQKLAQRGHLAGRHSHKVLGRHMPRSAPKTQKQSLRFGCVRLPAPGVLAVSPAAVQQPDGVLALGARDLAELVDRGALGFLALQSRIGAALRADVFHRGFP